METVELYSQMLSAYTAYLQNLIKRLGELGYQNIEDIRVVHVQTKEDIEREIRLIAQSKKEQFIDAVNRNVADPTEEVLNLSNVVFVVESSEFKDMVVTKPTVVWNTLEFPINVAMDWQRKRSFFKPKEDTSIGLADSKIPWADTKIYKKELPFKPFPYTQLNRAVAAQW